ncbi:MAG: hypothetical protein G01um101413_955 [Parcubacteria group bacterium Gr01-1014_13]|nr:MAG: hypothetical protein G01um101413_955 [Parcubacteria group bacterium Gr01-1014_13]
MEKKVGKFYGFRGDIDQRLNKVQEGLERLSLARFPASCTFDICVVLHPDIFFRNLSVDPEPSLDRLEKRVEKELFDITWGRMD